MSDDKKTTVNTAALLGTNSGRHFSFDHGAGNSSSSFSLPIIHGFQISKEKLAVHKVRSRSFDSRLCTKSNHEYESFFNSELVSKVNFTQQYFYISLKSYRFILPNSKYLKILVVTQNSIISIFCRKMS